MPYPLFVFVLCRLNNKQQRERYKGSIIKNKSGQCIPAKSSIVVEAKPTEVKQNVTNSLFAGIYTDKKDTSNDNHLNGTGDIEENVGKYVAKNATTTTKLCDTELENTKRDLYTNSGGKQVT